MALSNADRQKLWRERHKDTRKIPALQARIAELEVELAALRGQPSPVVDRPVIRIKSEWPLDDDFEETDDEANVAELFDRYTGLGRYRVPCPPDRLTALIDLLDRCGPQVIDAGRRRIAELDARWTAYSAKRKPNRKAVTSNAVAHAE